MAETIPLKRHREEEEEEQTLIAKEEETTKRQKLNQINNDLTSYLTDLIQENHDQKEIEDTWNDSCVSSKEIEEEVNDDDYKEKVMQHLLEASDDELGIPNNTEFGGSDYEMIKDDVNQDYNYVYGDSLLDGFGDVFWELEDEAANYYTLLQSQLFL
ncbi:unnamed protein product [Cochlearia groenlandica]